MMSYKSLIFCNLDHKLRNTVTKFGRLNIEGSICEEWCDVRSRGCVLNKALFNFFEYCSILHISKSINPSAITFRTPKHVLFLYLFFVFRECTAWFCPFRRRKFWAQFPFHRHFFDICGLVECTNNRKWLELWSNSIRQWYRADPFVS